jgi:hypothetical protein
MKVIITEKQYSLIKESHPNKGISAIIKYWKKELEKGNEIRFNRDELELWAISKFTDQLHAQTAFQELVGDEVFAEKFIKKLVGKKFSTTDFKDSNVGGYDFDWVITEVSYRDYDFWLFGKTFPGSSVTLMDGRHLSLEEALEDGDIGWEIQEEVNDVVQDCMNEIILPVTGYDVSVPVVYIY